MPRRDHDPDDAWTLPGSLSFLAMVEEALIDGVAFVMRDAATPPGLGAALESFLSDEYPTIEAVVPVSGTAPARTLSSVFGAAPDIADLVLPGLAQNLAIVDCAGMDDGALASWSIFAARFASARGAVADGLAILFLNVPASFHAGIPDPPEGSAQRWCDHLGRLDLVIWADRHVRAKTSVLGGAMAAQMAVELCGWRLDLSAQMARAATDDLADPLAWLRRRDSAPIPGIRMEMRCPLDLLDDGEATLRRRIWRAQLATLYPWLEDRRLALVEAHREALCVDDHLRDLGVGSVDEIEIGALAYQLYDRLARAERDDIHRLKAMRNALAHRAPAAPADVRAALADPLPETRA